MNKSRWVLPLSWLLAAAILLTGCHTQGSASPSPSPSASPSATPFPPSPTPIPLAAVVNGTPIPLSAFQAEYARFRAAQSALGTEIAPQENAPQWVLNDLIDQMLLADGAYRNGYTPPDDATLWQQATQEAGGEQALTDFLARQGYSRKSFLAALRQARAAAWMVQHIAAQVPSETEQVHVYQILVYNEEEAKNILRRLQQGEKFQALAAAYDPQGRGDLGWFPRGYLSQPAIEQAAFALKVGEVSNIIHTSWGYHIIQVAGREERPLSPTIRRRLQMQAVQRWLKQQRTHSTIQILLTPTP